MTDYDERGDIPATLMTAREVVAAQALAGLLASVGRPYHQDDVRGLAKLAVDCAEALLAECAARDGQL